MLAMLDCFEALGQINRCNFVGFFYLPSSEYI